mmetsp:Transcript_41060/g.73481  ORF Transcript_41060/g.73481 Transcript_41060/m.73481 type:complete len:351 (-) Transcript_41060:262-1314(-)
MALAMASAMAVRSRPGMILLSALARSHNSISIREELLDGGEECLANPKLLDLQLLLELFLRQAPQGAPIDLVLAEDLRIPEELAVLRNGHPFRNFRDAPVTGAHRQAHLLRDILHAAISWTTCGSKVGRLLRTHWVGDVEDLAAAGQSIAAVLRADSPQLFVAMRIGAEKAPPAEAGLEEVETQLRLVSRALLCSSHLKLANAVGELAQATSGTEAVALVDRAEVGLAPLRGLRDAALLLIFTMSEGAPVAVSAKSTHHEESTQAGLVLHGRLSWRFLTRWLVVLVARSPWVVPLRPRVFLLHGRLCAWRPTGEALAPRVLSMCPWILGGVPSTGGSCRKRILLRGLLCA